MILLYALLASLALPVLAQPPAVEQPGLELHWNPRSAQLWVLPPEGEHLAPTAPAFVELQAGGPRWTVDTWGADLAQGLGLPALHAPTSIDGLVRVALCQDGGSECRVVELELCTMLDGARGRLIWNPSPVTPAPVERPPEHGEQQGMDWPAAQVASALDGEPILLDFGATWCPPCQLLLAEVLHNPAHSDVLAGFHLVAVDADTPESWPLKDRFAVGGYPTLVLADASGGELARLEGYPGAEPFLRWLGAAAARGGSLDARLERFRVGGLDPGQASLLALDLARAERPEPALEVLAAAADDEPAHRAGLLLEGGAAHVDWLAEHAMGQFASWTWDAVESLQADVDLQQRVLPPLRAALAVAEPLQAAGGLEVLAELVDDDQADGLYAAAAALTGQALTGEPAHDRGLWSHQAWLLEQAGAVDPALAVLGQAIEHYPEEFTYHYSRARLLLRAGRAAQAEPAARQALAQAYGDQGLRAATTLAEILAELDRAPEGVVALDEALAAFPRPAEGLQVRSWRYLDAAESLRSELRDEVR